MWSFGKSKSKILGIAPDQKIRSFFDEGVAISGSINFVDGFETRGTIEGDLIGGENSLAVVGEKGVIGGKISAVHVVVAGLVKGPIHAKGSVSILNTGVVDGDIEYGSLSMEQGAVVNGTLKKVEGEVVPPKKKDDTFPFAPQPS